MIASVKLSKSATQHQRFHLTEGWISTRHWALRRSRCLNPQGSPAELEGSLGAGAQVVEQGSQPEGVLEGIAGRGGSSVRLVRECWTLTRLDDEVEYVPYRTPQGDLWAWVDRCYADLFQPAVLYTPVDPTCGEAGCVLDPLLDDPDDAGLIIMPVIRNEVPPGCRRPSEVDCPKCKGRGRIEGLTRVSGGEPKCGSTYP